MSLEPIGATTLILGLLCMLLGYRATAIVFVVMTSLGSAAAILIGGANIQPAHLFIVFVAFTTLLRRRMAVDTLNALRVTEPGFWLLCLTLYGVASSFVMPRLLADTSQIIPLGASEHLGGGDGVVPLGPVSSNLTQSIYLCGDLLCFLMISGIAAHRRGFDALTRALVAFSAAMIIFAMLDVATSATGTQDLLNFIRNAQYTFHDEESVGDMRRIIGSWPEASAFAGISLGALGYTGTLWLCGRWPYVSGILALLTLIFILLSTSSSGLVGAGLVLALLYWTALNRCGLDPKERTSAVTVVLAPLILAIGVLAVLLDNETAARLNDYLDALVLTKSTSSSGLQRSSWNIYAWKNFIDSWGLGVGLGTNRTSSFPLAILSNVGVPGAIFYILFAGIALGPRRGVLDGVVSDVRLAARNGCIGLIGIAIIAGPTVDQGLLFYVLAAMASAVPDSGHIFGSPSAKPIRLSEERDFGTLRAASQPNRINRFLAGIA